MQNKISKEQMSIERGEHWIESLYMSESATTAGEYCDYVAENIYDYFNSDVDMTLVLKSIQKFRSTDWKNDSLDGEIVAGEDCMYLFDSGAQVPMGMRVGWKTADGSVFLDACIEKVEGKEIRESLEEDLSPGCKLYEAGDYFFEVCPFDVFVTHKGGRSMVFSFKDIERRKMDGNFNPYPVNKEYYETRCKSRACDAMIKRVANVTIVDTKLAATGKFDLLKESLKKRKSSFLYDSLVESYENCLTQTVESAIRENEKQKEKAMFYRNFVTISTEEDETLEYFFGDKGADYGMSSLECDDATKLEAVFTILSDQCMFEQFDRFSNDGMRDFISEFGTCDGIVDLKDSFEKTDRCITIPVDAYDEAIRAWASEGITEDGLVQLEKGELPDGY